MPEQFPSFQPQGQVIKISRRQPAKCTDLSIDHRVASISNSSADAINRGAMPCLSVTCFNKTRKRSITAAGGRFVGRRFVNGKGRRRKDATFFQNFVLALSAYHPCRPGNYEYWQIPTVLPDLIRKDPSRFHRGSPGYVAYCEFGLRFHAALRGGLIARGLPPHVPYFASARLVAVQQNMSLGHLILRIPHPASDCDFSLSSFFRIIGYSWAR